MKTISTSLHRAPMARVAFDTITIFGVALVVLGPVSGVVLFVIYAATRLRVMPMGRAWEALREDEAGCRSLGMNHVGVKLSAFMLGASIGGLGWSSSAAWAWAWTWRCATFTA